MRRLVSTLPLLLPLLLACLGTACTALLVLGLFDGRVALLLALVLTAVCARVLHVDEELTQRAWRLDLAALLLVLAFGGFQGAMSGQDLDVVRDPGVYSVTAKWLTDHSDLSIDTELRRFGSEPGLVGPSVGFGPTTELDHVYAQGAHVLPAVLAVVGSVAGDGVMYRSNALVGAVGLLALYGLGRRLVGREVALAATALLACTLPLTAFTRDVYTEPYSQALLLGGLALLWRARDGRLADWAVAGLVLGGSCLARIDAYLVLPFAVTYLALRAAVLPDLRRRGLEALALASAAAVPAVLGWVDLTRLAPGYYRDLRGQFLSLMALLVVSVVAGLVLVVVGRRTRLLAQVPRLADVAAGAVVLAGLVLAARPLVYTSHGITDKPQQDAIAAVQQGTGAAVDGTRSYAESSVTWLAWYLGPLLAAAALFGTALLLRRALQRRELRTVPFLLVFLATSALYLVNPSITPDQVWAMRRYVPVVMPGAALVGTWALWLALQRLTGRRRTVGLVAVAGVLLAPMAFLARPLVPYRELHPQLAEVQRVCAALPDDAAVVLTGAFAERYPMTVRTFCHVPAVSQRVYEPTRLATAVEALGDRPVFLLTADDPGLDSITVEASSGERRPLSTISVRHWVRAVETPPRAAPAGKRELYLGRLGPQGTVVAWVTAPASVG